MTDSASFQPHDVDLFFDPHCPWAWMTSRWLTEVAEARGLNLHLHLMPLVIVNEGKDVPADYRAGLDRQWGVVRVFQAAKERLTAEQFAALYTAVGTKFHPEDRKSEELAVVTEALAELDLPADLVEAAEDSSLDEAFRATTATAQKLVGDDVGVPVIKYGDGAFFGPVVTPAPTGEDALRLWDGFALVVSVPGLYELKRTRTSGPILA
ncbi:disulfide bond formation protein DsbA [Georgenia sp. Z1344]|uniref:mycothiol-dependent nitroreductase Rv2466c family protein n=1 Tax=Georgenia sp. Z1344 TaxID=3416706 RepID=UPI003CF8673B